MQQWFRNLRIARKLMLLMVGTSAGAVLLAFSGFFTFEFARFRRNAVRETINLAEVLAANAATPLVARDSAAARDLLHTLRRDPRVLFAQLWLAEGTLFADYTRSDAVASRSLEAAPAEEPEFKGQVLTLFRPVGSASSPVGQLRLRIDLGEVWARYWEYLGILGVVLLLTVLFAALLAAPLQRLISRPIVALTQAARAAPGTRPVLAPGETRGDEIGQLLSGFNQMATEIREQAVVIEQTRDAVETTVSTRTRELQEQIGAHQRTEAQLEQARVEAEAADRAKLGFLASVSRSLSLPMRRVVETTGKLLASSLSEPQRQFAEHLQQDGQALLTFVNDLADLSQIEAGRVSLASIPFDLAEVSTAVMTELDALAVEKGLALGLSVDSEVPTGLRGDPARWRQILQHLVRNALQATQQGVVQVQIRAAELSSASATLRIEVHDTGPGVPPERQAGLFRPFTSEPKPEVNGGARSPHGIGLPLCARLARMMGGDIGVESQPGQGAMFWFTARFARTPPPSVPTPRPTPHRLASIASPETPSPEAPATDPNTILRPPDPDQPAAARPRAQLDRGVWDELHRLAANGEPGFVEGLIHLFFRETPRTLETFRDAFERRDHAGLQREAHRLCGSCRSLGASSLDALCREILTCADENRYEEAAPRVARLGAEFSSVKASLEDELAHMLEGATTPSPASAGELEPMLTRAARDPASGQAGSPRDPVLTS